MIKAAESKQRAAKRITIEYNDGSHVKLDHGLVSWFGTADGKTYAADYELIGLSERDLAPLAFSIFELAAKILLSGEEGRKTSEFPPQAEAREI